MDDADASPARARADKIIVAITEAIIAAQRNPGESSSTAWVNTTATLEALAEVAARIALQTKIAVTTADGGEFAEWIADKITRTSMPSGRATKSILSPRWGAQADGRERAKRHG